MLYFNTNLGATPMRKTNFGLSASVKSVGQQLLHSLPSVWGLL